MNTLSQTLPTPPSIWSDYLQLCKPRVVALLVLTSMIGMLMVPTALFSISTFIFGNIGIALAAGSAAIINHLVDQHIDRLMQRTATRPIAQGRISKTHAVLFATVLGLLAFITLHSFTNQLTILLTFVGLFVYAVVYTLYLKRATPQNIVIGGIAGALPPLLGWTALTNTIHPHALLLMLIVFIWTPPHFWALAIHRVSDYAKADIPMLPVTHGIEFTKTSILLYTILLAAVTTLPYITHLSGPIYLWGSVLLNGRFLYLAFALKFNADAKLPFKMFKYSIVYLMVLFLLLLLDHFV